jgi:hypothetical protein
MSFFKGLARWFWGWLGFASILATIIPGYLILKKVTIPDWLVLVLLAMLALGEGYIFSYIRHNEKKSESSGQTADVPAPSEAVLFIMRTLAGLGSEYTSRGGLQVVYEKAFEGRDADEFPAVLGALHGSKLVDYSPLDRDLIHISDKGSAYYLKHKGRPKRTK